mmetsp:Transcript_16650/g.52183  ORF Transcript_16650/g.52183 Transcript_16650/m.52183 type:complete len:188 (-) Transcript_16650:753-1316(-)
MNTDPFRMSRDENSPMEMGKTPDSGGIYLSRPVTRPPLGEVQRNLSSAAFGASPTLLKSPVETVTPPGPQMGEMRNSMGLSGEWQKLVNIVTWEDRHKSAVYFAAGNAMFLTASILSLDGVLPCTPLTMAAYCLIIHLFVNFMKATVKGAPVSPSPLKPQEIQVRIPSLPSTAGASADPLCSGEAKG